MSDVIPVFSHCPRCGEKAYDVLRTHCYCVECHFSPDLENYQRFVPKWVSYRIVEAKRPSKKISKRSKPKSEGDLSWR